jgi:DNA polymerase-3 subunit delta
VKYDNLSAFEKHLEEAKTKQFSSLYLILGKETFELQEAIQMVVRFILPIQEKREFALSTFEGAQIEEKQLWTALDSPSFFAETRVIWIQQADKLRKSLQEELEKSFARPLPGQYLILSATGWNKNTSFYKAAEKAGIVLELAEIKPWEKEKRLAEWVNKQAAAARKLMSFQVCQALVKQSGADPATLAQELDKLICYCGEKQEVTLQDMEAICTRQPFDSIWQLGEAIFRRDTSSALQMIHSLLMSGQALLPLLRQLRSQFQTEYQICLLLAQGKHAQDIRQEFPYMKGQILERHIRQAQHYGLEACRQGLLSLDAIERRMKNSVADDRLLAEILMMQLTFPLQPHK